jgi:hypothetical protein
MAVIAPVRLAFERRSALHKLPCGRMRGVEQTGSQTVPTDRVRDFEQRFGYTLFDDRNCEERNSSIATRIYEPFVLFVALKKRAT